VILFNGLGSDVKDGIQGRVKEKPSHKSPSPGETSQVKGALQLPGGEPNRLSLRVDGSVSLLQT